jgi:hypothetical protein
MKALWTDFFIEYLPACAIAIAGLWFGIYRSGFWSVLGWMTAVGFGSYATWQAVSLVSALVRPCPKLIVPRPSRRLRHP